MIKEENSYNASQLDVLEGLEAVRLRPGMYIGSTSSRGLHHLVWEIVDNSVDEALAGYCDKILVKINIDGSITVKDNGRGMPIDLHPKKKVPGTRVIFTYLHAGGKFRKDSYKVSGGLHGVGASVVNALSKWVDVEVYRNGKIYKDRYENGGHPVTPLIDGLLPATGKTNERGTSVTFMPDDSILETTEFKAETIKKRLKELSYLNKGLLLEFLDMKSGEEIEFHEQEGIVGFIKDITKHKETNHNEVMYFSGNSSNIDVEIAIQYTKEYNETILSYCNNINTIEGGNHVTGFKTALTRILNQYAREIGVLKEKDDNFEGKDVRSGITAIILIKHQNPQFEGQTKTKLGNSDVKAVVDEILSAELSNYFDRNIEILKSVLDNAIKSYRVRKAVDGVKKNILNGTNKMAINGKLASCSSRDNKITELFIVEGDSAGGSAKQARDRNTQAILPLRGKILNIEKALWDKIISSTSIQSLINSLGCGIGEGYGCDFDISKLDYNRIIIMTDADVDGSHIRILLLTFFYRYYLELIIAGKIFIGMPPLYKTTMGKNIKYLYKDIELEIFKQNANGKTFSIQRYKGLGEMNADQLWETTMNPETRFLKKVTIEDAVIADEITTILMGDKVGPRKDFIYEEAINAKIDM